MRACVRMVGDSVSSMQRKKLRETLFPRVNTASTQEKAAGRRRPSTTVKFSGGLKEAFLLKQKKDLAKAEADIAREQERLRKVKMGLIPDDPPAAPAPAANRRHTNRRGQVREEDDVPEVEVRARHEAQILKTSANSDFTYKRS